MNLNRNWEDGSIKHFTIDQRNFQITSTSKEIIDFAVMFRLMHTAIENIGSIHISKQAEENGKKSCSIPRKYDSNPVALESSNGMQNKANRSMPFPRLISEHALSLFELMAHLFG